MQLRCCFLVSRRCCCSALPGKVNPTIKYAGPEGTDYTDFLLDPSNHKGPGPRRAPDILSLHHSLSGSDTDGTCVRSSNRRRKDSAFAPCWLAMDLCWRHVHVRLLVESVFVLSVAIVSLLRSSSHAHSSPNLRCNNRGKGYESFFSGLDSFTTTDPDSDSLTLAEMNDKRDKIAPYAEVRRQNPAV